MCMLMTLLAAVIATVTWYVTAPKRNLYLGTLSLMYWGAGLMWLVDGVFCVIEGGSFLDLSVNDVLLGALIILCGLAVWLVVLLRRNPRGLFAAFGKKHRI